MGPFRRAWNLVWTRHLLATNLSLSFCLSGLGDLLQQRIEVARKVMQIQEDCWMQTYSESIKDLTRNGIKVVLRKVVVDQILFSPVCIAACFFVAGVCEGLSRKEILHETIQKGYQLYIAEWLVWPPAQSFNFYFLPTRFRVAFDNVVSLGFDFYTSYLKHSFKQVTIQEECT